MVTQENPNTSSAPTVAHHQMTLEYSIISQQIIHSFEIIHFDC